MNIEIWSDVACPFCYIGKRNLETALAEFKHRDKVEIAWRSFQLDPDLPRRGEGDVHDLVAQKFGGSRERAVELNKHVAAMGAEAGIEFNFDAVVVTNTFDAHRLIKLAVGHNLAAEAEERLFAGFFCQGADLGDYETLLRLGLEIGLAEDDLHRVLGSDEFATEIWADILAAQELGISAVPAFVFNRQALLSGAQKPAGMLEALEQAWQKQQPELTVVHRNGQA